VSPSIPIAFVISLRLELYR